MSKYEEAIIKYEERRLAIILLTEKIKNAALHLNTGRNGDYYEGNKCETIGNSFGNTLTCISRSWLENVEVCIGYDSYPEESELVLCQSCSEVQKLVDERKRAKRVFGVAKLSLSALTKGLLKQLEERKLTR